MGPFHAGSDAAGRGFVARDEPHPDDITAGMPEALANGILAVLAAYLAAGVVFAVAFHAGGIRRIDADAAHGTWGFRVVVTPGVVLLWPALVACWRRGTGVPAAPRDAHRAALPPDAAR